jgi:hypothetical protein
MNVDTRELIIETSMQETYRKNTMISPTADLEDSWTVLAILKIRIKKE